MNTATNDIFQDAQKKFGFVPNVIKEMSKNPAVAGLYLKAQEYLAEGVLSSQEQQAVQLAVSAKNDCHYCSAAHTAGGSMMGLEACDLKAVGEGLTPANKDVQPAVEAARIVFDKQGWLSEDDLKTFESQGIDRARLYEIITLIGLKTITNYINHVAQTPVDDELQPQEG